MRSLSFTIPLPPRGQSRKQTRVLTDRNGQVVRSAKSGRAVVIHHDSDKQKQDTRSLEALLYEWKPPAPIEGPVKLLVRAYFPIPKSKPKKWREAALAEQIRHTGKPDLSNVLKNIEDVMNGVFWRDDSQIVEFLYSTGKYYGDPARYEIEIQWDGVE